MSVYTNEMHTQEYEYDFAADGGAVGVINLSSKAGAHVLPVGAMVKKVSLKVVTAFTSGGAATVSWGPTASATGYSGTAVAVASLTANASFNGEGNGASLVFNDVEDSSKEAVVGVANDGDMKLTIAAAALTAGRAIVNVQYYNPTA